MVKEIRSTTDAIFELINDLNNRKDSATVFYGLVIRL